MTTSTDTNFAIHPIPETVFERVRADGVDAFGNPVEHVMAGGGEPLRCCLRDAAAGEPMILFGYEPPLPPSPYRETGAVYAHRDPCGGPSGRSTDYPAGLRGRAQALRAYDERGWIHDARTHDGEHPERVLAEMLADRAVVQIHSRNIAYGCYNFTVTRA